jgi:Response regulator containing CheY-like receiver, AAA-type ATPase, and DNA-binding domains
MKQEPNPANKTTISSTKKFILLGEDDIDDQEILEEIFSSIDSSLQLHFINNGKKLVAHLDEVHEENLPCLIVLDYNMPELNGAEILKNLQENHRVHKVPKIIWSTSNAPAYKNMCLELGACDYLVKPSKIDMLENMVKHMLSYCD